MTPSSPASFTLASHKSDSLVRSIILGSQTIAAVQSHSNTKNIAAQNNKTANRHLSNHSLIQTINIEDTSNLTTSDNTVRSTCPYCGVGCGVLASVDDSGAISVQGDPDHPANFGKLCSKGSALAQTLVTERRLTEPYYNKSYFHKNHAYKNHANKSHLDKPYQLPTDVHFESVNTMAETVKASWDTVLDDIAQRLNATIAEHGRDSVMFYVSGQLLTEDYYVANKLIKGFIGNNNIDSNSRLCMSSAVAGHKRAFGADLVPGNYEDFEACDLLVLTGSNMAWCHPILFGRFLTEKKANPHKKLVVIDPRRTDSCEFADLHLPIAAGTDTHLYNGLLTYLEQNGCRDSDYTSLCEGLDEALASAEDWDIEKVAKACDVDAALILEFYQLVAAHPKTVTAFSMGVNQSSSGTDKVNAIINTHLLTGRVGKVGASPFSLTGQPNAMGGREVGALANLLAAHLDLDNSQHRALVEAFWQAPQAISPQVGVKACDAADAILEGRIKAIWIMATNPVVSLPEADKFRRALDKCDLVIVSDCSKDSDTVQCADIVLPAQGWGEKSGTVTNSERRISRQRQLMPALGEAKPDWWILSQVAQRMGLSGFDYSDPSEIFNEHVALTAWGNSDGWLDNKSQANQSQTNRSKQVTLPRYLNLAHDLSQSNHSLADHDNLNADDRYDAQDVNDAASVAMTDFQSSSTQCIKLSKDEYDDMAPFQWGGSRIDVTAPHCTTTKASFVAILPPSNASKPNFYQASFRGESLNNTHQVNDRLHQANDRLENINPLNPSEPLATQEPIGAINLRLITGRLRDQWHTMTRTGLAPVLNQQQSVPTLTLHPNDAIKIGVADADFVGLSPRMLGEIKQPTEVINKTASCVSSNNQSVIDSNATGIDDSSHVMAQVAISDSMREGDAFMPMHWSNAFASLARVGTLIPTVVDPHSHQPELKNTAICVRPVAMRALGKILVHPDWQDAMLVQLRTLMNDLITNDITMLSESSNTAMPNLTWSLCRQEHSVLFHLACPERSDHSSLLTPAFWQQFADTAQAALAEVTYMRSETLATAFITNDQADDTAHSSSNTDNAQTSQTSQLRLIVTQDRAASEKEQTAQQSLTADQQPEKAVTATQLMMAVFIAPETEQLPSSHWLDSCFDDLSDLPKGAWAKWLLAGRPASGYVDPGPLVCACMSVGENIIIKAITEQGCMSAAEVGQQCRAGTNCGSCVGQINELIANHAAEYA